MSRLVVALALLLGLASCASPPGPGPVFDNEGARQLSCMVHQAGKPGPRYTETAMRDTAEVLAVMRYYTANGAKPYCDGAPAGEVDREWARLYVDLGGAPENAASVLG